MKRFILFCLILAGYMAVQAKTNNQPYALIFPAEHTAPANNTGDVKLSMLKDSGTTIITHFLFSPGSRNYWHYHPGIVQTLLVLDGVGWYQEDGNPKRRIKKGDVIVTPADVKHWNGATSDKPLVCITVTESGVDGHVVQLRPVTDEEYGYCMEENKKPAMCEKLPMSTDGITRLSKIEVFPEWIEEYMKHATEVGAISLQTEPGVLTMYAVADKDNPCNITILETYSSQEAYRRHIASPHFQKYKQGTLHMIKSLVLDDVIPLNPDNQITNFIIDR